VQSIEKHAVGSPEWVAARRRGLGASEIGAACGVSRHKSRFQLWQEKTCRAAPFGGNAATRWGHRHEAWIVEDWCEANSARAVETQGTYPLEGVSVPQIWSTPDAIVVLEDGSRSLLEAKSTTWRNADLGEDGTDCLPVEWVAQAQCQMATTGIERCCFGVLVDGRDLREYRVDWDANLWHSLLQRCIEFWSYVAEDRLPPVEWSHDCELMDRFRWLPAELPSIDLRGDPAAEKWAEYEAIGKRIADLEKQRDALKTEFIRSLGDHGLARVSDDREVRVIEVAGGPVSYVRKDSFQLRARKVK